MPLFNGAFGQDQASSSALEAVFSSCCSYTNVNLIHGNHSSRQHYPLQKDDRLSLELIVLIVTCRSKDGLCFSRYPHDIQIHILTLYQYCWVPHYCYHLAQYPLA